MGVLLVTLLAILVLFYVWSRGRGRAQSVPSYFFNAVKVYALLGEEDAKVAARAAGKMATPRQRAMMLDYLNKRTSDLLLETAEQNAGQNPLMIVERLLQLKQEMSLQDERAPDLIPEKQWLQDHNQAYLRALGRGDPSVFVDQHPDLFSSQTTKPATAKNNNEAV